MQNNIIFLGTGTSQGVPMIGCSCPRCQSLDTKDKRLRTSAYIEYNDMKIVIDAGPDFRQQMLRENIGYLDAILLTHHHKDHTGGLDDVRAFNYIQKEKFPVYAEDYVLESIRKEYSYAFEKIKYPGIPEFNLHPIENKPFHIKDTVITPIRAIHLQLPILGFRLGNLAYITDANHIPEQEMEKLKGLEIFVLNTVRREKHISHFSLDEAIEICQKVGAKSSYLTHFSHQMDCYQELSESLPKNIYSAYDGLRLIGF